MKTIVGYVAVIKNSDGTVHTDGGKYANPLGWSRKRHIYMTHTEAVQRIGDTCWDPYVLGREGWAVLTVVKVRRFRPVAPGRVVVGYRVRRDEKEGKPQHSHVQYPGGPCTRAGKPYLFPTEEAARKDADAKYYVAGNMTIPTCPDRRVVRVTRKAPDPTIEGWIVRKRHPHVFATKAEAVRVANRFPSCSPCKVVPVRAGHEALKGRDADQERPDVRG